MNESTLLIKGSETRSIPGNQSQSGNSCSKSRCAFPAGDVEETCNSLRGLDSFVALPLWRTWEFVFLIPFAAEVHRSSQTDQQQTHTEHSEDDLLLSHWLNYQLHIATPGPVEAIVTLAVVLVDVHQQHALAVVQTVVVECFVTCLCRPFHHMRALFSLTCRGNEAVFSLKFE